MDTTVKQEVDGGDFEPVLKQEDIKTVDDNIARSNIKSHQQLRGIKLECDQESVPATSRKTRKRHFQASDSEPASKHARLVRSEQQETRPSSIHPHQMKDLFAPGLSTNVDENASFIPSYQMDAQTRDTAKITLGKQDQTELDQALRRFKTVEARGDDKYKVPQCTTPLLVWQLISADQMIRREKVRKLPFGGVLSSEMGLGKTLTMLTVIAFMNTPKTQKKTLIIVPNSSLVDIWETEAKARCNMDLIGPVLRYKQKTSHQSDTSLEDINKASIILTTYNEIRQGAPDYKELQSLKTPKKDKPSSRKSSRRSLPTSAAKFDKLEDQASQDLSQQAIDSVYARASNPLFQVVFHRVIIDEGHAIRNRNSKTTNAILSLRKKVGWVITGTPLSNTPDEIFPYLQFIGDPESQSRPGFVAHYFKDEGDETMKAMRKSVSEWFISWRNSDTFLGRVINDLPKVHTAVQWIEMSAEEHIILESLQNVLITIYNEREDEKKRIKLRETYSDTSQYHEQCDRIPIPYEAAANDRGKDFKTLISCISMLRNAATHPYLLEPVFRDVYTTLELVELRKKLQLHKESSPDPLWKQIGPWTARVKALHQYGPEATTATGAQITPSQTSDSEPFGISEVGTSFDFTRQLDCLITMKDQGKLKCAGLSGNKCEEQNGSFWRAKCGHIICGGCKADLSESSRSKKSRQANRCGRKGCRKNFKGSIEPLTLIWHLFHLPSRRDAVKELEKDGGGGSKTDLETNSGSNSDDSGDDSGSDSDSDSDQSPTRNKGGGSKEKLYLPGDDIMGYQPKPNHPSRLLAMTDTGPRLPLVGSGKLAAVKETVLRWQMEAPEDKILIFVAHKIFAQCIARVLEAERKPFLSYFGDTGSRARDKILERFKRDENIPILIISMDCGGQGLNITEANRVIIAELWWNEAKEQQAFGRVSRIGQKKPMFQTRFIVRRCYEEEIRRRSQNKTWKINNMLLREDVPDLEANFHKILRYLGEPEIGSGGHIVGFTKRDKPDELEESGEESD